MKTKTVKGVKMRNLGKIVWSVMLGLGLSYGDSVIASVDSKEVVRGNSVTLSLKALGGKAGFPNIKEIDNIPIVGTSTSSSQNWTLSNGDMHNESSTTRLYQFTPKKNMIIPSYSVNIDGKVYKTKPISIKVVKSSAPANKGNQMFTLTIKSEKNKVKVGESFMITAYFALRTDIQVSQNIQYTPPNFTDFSIIEMEQAPAYIKGNYQIQEIRYIATAITEGNFTLSKAQIKVAVRSGKSRGFFGNFSTKSYQTHSNTLDIKVLAQSQASEIVGDFKVSTSLDNTEAKINKPVNLSIKIEGEGNLKGFELPEYKIDGVTIYSDETKIDTKVVNGKLYSIFSQSFAFISTGDFTIPKREILSYNNKKDTLETLVIKSFDIIVKGKVFNQALQSQTPMGVVQTKSPQNNQSPLVVEKRVEVKSIAWWMLVLAFIVGMLVMYLGRFIPKLRKRTSYNEKEALKLLYGHINEDKEIEQMVRKLYAKQKGDKSVSIDKKVLKGMVERVELK